jgi:dimethylamine/trimethylamine dehydrogenase
MDPRHACLFEPIDIGPKTLKNRFYAVPHCVGFGADQALAQALFRGMKAVGGWGAICTEYTGISPEADDTYHVNARLWDEDDVASLSLTVDTIHRAGALAGAELWHGGVHTPNLESRSVTRGPTQIASDVEYTVTCKEMNLADIREIDSGNPGTLLPFKRERRFTARNPGDVGRHRTNPRNPGRPRFNGLMPSDAKIFIVLKEPAE